MIEHVPEFEPHIPQPKKDNFLPVEIVAGHPVAITIAENKPIAVKKEPQRHLDSLGCLVVDSLEFHHFQMNYEKCKQLNSIYTKFSSSLNVNYKSVNYNLKF